MFFDDILVYNKTWQEHLNKVLEIIGHRSIFDKVANREFRLIKKLYLGYVISAQGVQVDQEKRQAIMNWSTPTLTKLRGFLGL